MDYDALKDRFDDKMAQGYHCSQALLEYWAEKLGIDPLLALRTASGLGMGCNCGNVCGAITSTAIALSWAHGFSNQGCNDKPDGIEAKVKEVEAAFVEKNGTLLCQELLYGKEESYQALKSDPSGASLQGLNPWLNCGRYCADAVEAAEKLMEGFDVDWYQAVCTAGAPDPEPNYVPVVASGVGGLAVGALAASVVVYEKRRAENEGKR